MVGFSEKMPYVFVAVTVCMRVTSEDIWGEFLSGVPFRFPITNGEFDSSKIASVVAILWTDDHCNRVPFEHLDAFMLS